MLILTLFSSCIREEFNADLVDRALQINPGVAAPVGWAKYRLDEILADSLHPGEMIIDGNGFISMVYRQEFYSLYASEIINIADLSSNSILDNPFGTSTDLSLLPEDTAFTYSIPLPLAINGTRNASIDSILTRWGLMSISVSSAYPDMIWDARFLIEGVPDWQVTLDDQNPFATDTLEGNMLTVDAADNSLPMSIILTLWPSGEVIDAGPILDVSISLSDVEYDVIYGYLGQFTVSAGPQSISVDFFDRTSGGTFYFSDPRLKINFLNSFGLPIQIDSLDFRSIGRNGQITAIEGDSIPDPSNPRIIAYPLWGKEGETMADSILLDAENSNLDRLLETSPDRIVTRISGTSNPDRVTHDNFMLDTSRLSISAELLLPLDGYADLLLIADTLEFVFGDFYDSPPEEIKRLIFRLNFESQFPVDVSTQLYFLDEGFNMLDSLFHDEGDPRKIVSGAPIDGNGIAEPYKPEPVEIELTREQIDNISACYFIIAKGKVTTTGYDPPDNIANVRFYSYYYFHTYVGAIAELEMNSDDY